MDDSSSKLLSGRGDCKQAANDLILTANESVFLLTQKLEPELYNDKAIHQHLVLLASHNRKTDIRIIAHDTRSASKNGHYLINLAQRLPTFAEIRCTVTPAHQRFTESWLIVDRRHFLRVRNLARYEANLVINSRLECKPLIETFLDIWEVSQPDQNTRRLSL
jgi:hypothetical protein